MIERIIDLSERAARLSVRHDQLVIAEGGTEHTVPMEDVAVLLLSHPALEITQGVVARLMECGGVLVAADSRRLPAGMLLPLEGHHLQTERLREQDSASEPARKRVWQQLVRAKVAAQGRVLAEFHGDDAGLAALAGRVQSGDAGGIESQAARRYFSRLFGELPFRRERDGEWPNAMLNYGYMALRAVVARAIVAAGLHPSLGVKHHNRYDAYCLAADLMEPYRPVIDRAVAAYVLGGGEAEGRLSPALKRVVLAPLTARYVVEDEERSLFDIAARTAVSLSRALKRTGAPLVLPEV